MRISYLSSYVCSSDLVSISIPLHGCRGGQKCRRRPRRAPGNLYWLHQKGRVAMFSGSLLAIVLLVAGVVILFKTVRVVSQGYEWTVERFGKYTYTMTPGMHLLVPIMYSFERKINMMEQVLEVPSKEVITTDNAVVKVDGLVFFQVLDAVTPPYEVATLEL